MTVLGLSVLARCLIICGCCLAVCLLLIFCYDEED